MKRATTGNCTAYIYSGISIHALVKRATNRRALQKSTKFNFNPRPREEGDNKICGFSPRTRDFNPRPREEGDLFENGRLAFATISIHALVKRATKAVILYSTNITNFNPRPREEGDVRKFWKMKYLVLLFQSTPS